MTAASTPETPSASAGRYAAKPVARRDRDLDRYVVEPAPYLGDHGARLPARPRSRPAPPRRNRALASKSEKLPPIAAATATRYAISADASLTRLSPSNTLSSRRGTPSCASDRRRRDRVGRRDDGAEREGDRPGQVDELVPDDRDRAGRYQHQSDRGQRQGAGVGAQCPQIGHEGRHIEQRRQEDHQHQVGLELDVGDAGEVAERDRPEHEHDWVRDAEQPSRSRSTSGSRRRGRGSGARSRARSVCGAAVLVVSATRARRWRGPVRSARRDRARRSCPSPARRARSRTGRSSRGFAPA